ncbi:MAG: hypothetical protein ACP5RE_00565 [Candidatus Acidifodinimicrobium sp.]
MERYSELFDENTRRKAHEFYLLCHNLKRWHSNGVLIVMDACLTSSGLNYFSVVVPRVQEFYVKYIKTRRIIDSDDVLKNWGELSLFSNFKNKRVWSCFFEVLTFISSSKKKQERDIGALHRWAVSADYSDMRSDPIGKIKGIGINTFQYLRMQSGVDTLMPDKIIRRWLERQLQRKINDDINCISYGTGIADKLKISPIELCWAIWIKESGEAEKIPI